MRAEIPAAHIPPFEKSLIKYLHFSIPTLAITALLIIMLYFLHLSDEVGGLDHLGSAFLPVSHEFQGSAWNFQVQELVDGHQSIFIGYGDLV